MAKREIPEINAGSMADIAFLLLLFFLVTTTMDKDQAYIRKIPQDIILPPTEVEERNILSIKANSQNKFLVRGSEFKDPDKISEFILEFYQTNEIKQNGDNNFPKYSNTTIAICDENIAKLEKLEEEAANKGANDQAKFFNNSISEWANKKNAISLYDKDVMREIDLQAHIRIEVQKGTAYSIFAKIHNEIEEAVFELRTKECQRLFNESYSILKKRTIQDTQKEDKAKIALLEILYPTRIVEVVPKN